MSDDIEQLRYHAERQISRGEAMRYVNPVYVLHLIEQLDEMQQTLEDIASPITKLRREAIAAGHDLEGQMAVSLSNDPNWLRSLAQKALDQWEEEASNTKAIPKDLAHLAEVVREWPDDSVSDVRLDADGEVCFSPSSCEYDFYPEEDDRWGISANHHPKFLPGSSRATGTQYTREEWENARNV